MELKMLELINDELEAENQLMKNKIYDLKRDNEFFRSETQRLSDELESIKCSRSYKILQKINKIIRRK